MSQKTTFSSVFFLRFPPKYLGMTLLQNLNERQKEAVSCLKGPLLVVAGAGSGKTLVLTHRVANLIANGVLPWNILAVTFTNKAAEEMQKRVARLLGENAPAKPLIGTFHSVGVKILRQEIGALDRKTSFTIFDADDTLALVRQICKDRGIPKEEFQPKALLGRISMAKNNFLTAAEYGAGAGNIFEKKVAEVFLTYEKELLKMNAVDFDDLLVLPVKIFQDFPAVREKYQKRWQYVLIDEFQDTNRVQALFAKLLSEKHGNICAIGDSDQAIYSFRGATIENILNFEKSFANCRVVKLEQNYRSTENILGAADSVIENNISRVPKKMFTLSGAGEKVKIFEYQNGRTEAESVMQEIKDLRKIEDRFYADFAILYRTNAQSRAFEEAALKYGIPYQIVGGVKFYARKEIKDLLAFLRVIANSSDTVSLLRIINVPPRKIGDITIQKLDAVAQRSGMDLFNILRHMEMAEGVSPAARDALSAFINKILALQKRKDELVVAELIHEIIEKFSLEAFYRDGTEEGEMRWENVRELSSVARKFDGTEHSLDLFLEEVALITDLDALDKDADRIKLMTLHNAKGLEFPVVFIGGVEEGILPHANSSLSPDGVEEERRLMYVGMTRAREKLYLTLARERIIFGDMSANLPSRFLGEIDEKFTETNLKTSGGFDDNITVTPVYDDYPEYVSDFAIGEKVSHAIFGEGRIERIEGDILTIAFKKVGTKRLAASIAPLVRVG